ncbi:MAG: Gfo/Idh/MocA family protein [Planctomycetota bacterium]|jgi:predicted dehydrogenase
MSEGKLKTAVLGLNADGQLLLKAAGQMEHFQIQAVADKDTNLAEKIAAEYECAAFDDYRQLITGLDSRWSLPRTEFTPHRDVGMRGENDIRCLLVAAGMHSCEEYVRMAMKKKFNILKLAPAARDFEEAAEFVCLGEDENVKFAIANPGRFARSFLALREFLEQGRIERVFLMTAFSNAGGQPYPRWQSDPRLAGGGVLLHNCYGIIDQIVWNFGMPQQVYSLNTNQAQDKQQRLYLTEDTSVVTMKFADTFIGNLIASRRGGIGPREEFLRLYGKDKILTVNQKRLTVSDGLGQVSEELEYDDDQLVCMMKVLENFALGILLPDKNKLFSSGRENLKDMAVIESAYLSARTAMPEEPNRSLQMASRRAGKAGGI